MDLEQLLQQVDSLQDEIVALHQGLVRIPTINTGVMPTGNETAACTYLAAKLGGDGIAAQILESAPGRGNLVARLAGSRGAPSLMLMGHTDVVPVEDESQWLHPPFAAEIHNGRIYGRGAADMKGMVAGEAMAMIILKRAGLDLAGDLILAAAADEEAGGAYGMGWLARHHPELVRADYAINEGGGAPTKTPDGGLAYMYNVGEKGRYELRITLKGRGWHASQPWRTENILYHLPELLQRIKSYRPQIDTSAALFGFIHELFGLPAPVTPANVDALADSLLPAQPGHSSALRAWSRLTLVPTMINAGVKSNSIAERCTVTCDIRSLPQQDEAYLRQEIGKLLDGLPGLSWELVCTAVSNASPADHPLADALHRATARAIGRADFRLLPGLTTGFTDSRLVRPLGCVTYGFAPDHPDTDVNLGGAHNINESEDIASLLTYTRMFVALAWDVLRPAR